MQETDAILMSLVIFVPVLFALAIPFFPKGKDEAVRWWTLFGTAATLGISLWIFVLYYYQIHDFNLTNPDRQTAMSLAGRENPSTEVAGTNGVWRYPWIPQFNIDYFVGLDGISLALVVMTTVLSFLAMIASWNIEKHVKGYCVLFLLLLTGMVGSFLALDF